MDIPQPYSDIAMLVIVIAISFWVFFCFFLSYTEAKISDFRVQLRGNTHDQQDHIFLFRAIAVPEPSLL